MHTHKGLFFLYQLMYLYDHTSFYTPFLHLQRLEVKRLTLEDQVSIYGPNNNNNNNMKKKTRTFFFCSMWQGASSDPFISLFFFLLLLLPRYCRARPSWLRGPSRWESMLLAAASSIRWPGCSSNLGTYRSKSNSFTSP